MLCDDLEGWDREDGREAQEGGDMGTYVCIWLIHFGVQQKLTQGLPWWRSGWESACQCRGQGFEPWSGKIPHAAEQLDP